MMAKVFSKRLLTLGLPGIAVFLAACAYQPTDNPAVRKFSWFSYLNGDDLRSACTADNPGQYRLVYNGIYVEQVRTYDLKASADGAEMRVQVTGKADLRDISVEEAGDLMNPWRGTIETVHLRPSDLDLLKRSLRSSGAFEPVAPGLQLSSDAFYWMVSACDGGRFHFNAYLWPSDRFKAASFAKLLNAWDPTKIAVNPPRPATGYEIHGDKVHDGAIQFNLMTGEGGLAMVKPLF